MEKFILGFGGAAMMIGLALMGLCVGASLSAGTAVIDHALFGAAVACLAAGASLVVLMMLTTGEADTGQT